MAQNVIPMTPIQRFQGQRPLRDAERQEVLDAEEQGLQTKIANAIKSEEQATGQPLSPDRKQQISATIRKVEPKQGAFTFRTNVNGTDVPPGSRDKYGQPVDPNKRYRVFEDRDGNQELYPEESKKTAAETRIDTAIKNEMSANPRLTREDAERTVRVRERNNAVNDAIAKGLRITSQELQNSATRKRIDKITGELRTGMLSTKNAKIISDGAWRRAKDRQNKDLDAMTRPLRDLYMEELHTMGVDLDELNAALRGSGTLPAGGEADTEAAKAHKRSQQTKPPTVNTPGGAIPQGWH